MTKLISLASAFALGAAMAACVTGAARSAEANASVAPATQAPEQQALAAPKPVPSMQPIVSPGDEIRPAGVTGAPAAMPALAAPESSTGPSMALGAKPSNPPGTTAAPNAPSAEPAPVEVPPLTASAKMVGSDGQELGTIMLMQTAHGVLITADLSGLPPGTHGFHIHSVGKCQVPFLSAEGHFDPTGAMHGFGPGGPHAGDMPNIHVGENGTVTVEVMNDMVSLDPGPTSLNDKDGSSIIIHANADDYATQPSGNAGARIACGVIEFPK